MTNPAPRVSVALATYNGAKFLSEQLETLASQTLLPYELVITDDNSSDDTIEVAKVFSGRAPFPVHIYINSERLGWRANFIKAAGLCGGDLISLCDQDDIWYPNKLEVMTRAFADDQVLLAFHDVDITDVKGQVVGRFAPIDDRNGRIAALSRPTNWSHPPGLTQLFRSSLLGLSKYWPSSIDQTALKYPAAHDQWFYYLSTNLGDVIRVNDRLLGYRQHSNNAVGFVDHTTKSKTLDRDEILRTISSKVCMLEAFVGALDAARNTELASVFPGLHKAYQQNRQFLDRERARGEIYTRLTLASRMGALIELYRKGAYSRDSAWNLGTRALVTDVFVGALFSRLTLH